MARPAPRGRGRNAKDGKKPNRGGGLFRRRKFCRFTAEKIKEVDYKDIAILKDFINENGKAGFYFPLIFQSVSIIPKNSAVQRGGYKQLISF